jgi:hypothetical protein
MLSWYSDMVLASSFIELIDVPALNAPSSTELPLAVIVLIATSICTLGSSCCTSETLDNKSLPLVARGVTVPPRSASFYIHLHPGQY